MGNVVTQLTNQSERFHVRINQRRFRRIQCLNPNGCGNIDYWPGDTAAVVPRSKNPGRQWPNLPPEAAGSLAGSILGALEQETRWKSDMSRTIVDLLRK